MIANSAFLAALTTFVIAAWLAAELSFLAPYKAAIFRDLWSPLGRGHCGAVSQPLWGVLHGRPLVVLTRCRTQVDAHRPSAP